MGQSDTGNSTLWGMSNFIKVRQTRFKCSQFFFTYGESLKAISQLNEDTHGLMARVVSGFEVHGVSKDSFLGRKSCFTSISEVQFDQTVSIVGLWAMFDGFWWFLVHFATNVFEVGGFNLKIAKRTHTKKSRHCP